MTNKWSKEWPTETGYYWFYGWCSPSRDEPPTVHLVWIRRSRTCVIRVTEGHFLYKADPSYRDGGYGMWKPAILPEPPKDFEEEE